MPGAILWLPEVLQEIRDSFREHLSWPEWIELADRVSATIIKARKTRGRRPLICADCGQMHAVSVASLFYQAERLRLIDRERAQELHGSWTAHRYEHRLDRHGRPLRQVSRRGGGRRRE